MPDHDQQQPFQPQQYPQGQAAAQQPTQQTQYQQQPQQPMGGQPGYQQPYQQPYQQQPYPAPMRPSNDTLTVKDWIITILLTAIPVVNIIMLFIWAFGTSAAPAKANWAKASLIWMLIGIVLSILMSVIFAAVGISMFDDYRGYYY